MSLSCYVWALALAAFVVQIFPRRRRNKSLPLHTPTHTHSLSLSLFLGLWFFMANTLLLQQTINNRNISIILVLN